MNIQWWSSDLTTSGQRAHFLFRRSEFDVWVQFFLWKNFLKRTKMNEKVTGIGPLKTWINSEWSKSNVHPLLCPIQRIYLWLGRWTRLSCCHPTYTNRCSDSILWSLEWETSTMPLVPKEIPNFLTITNVSFCALCVFLLLFFF